MKKHTIKKITLGIAMALGCNLMVSNVSAAEFDTAIKGISEATNATYVEAGILSEGKYTFSEDTALKKGTTTDYMGGWVAATVNAVISNVGADSPMVIDLQGHNLDITSSQTGITAGKDGKIDIYNTGKITVDTNSTGQAAGLFVKTGGQIHIHNGGEGNLWDKAFVSRTYTTNSTNGTGIKVMSDSSAEDVIKIDGLVDIVTEVNNSKGAGEAISVVAGVCDVGGGRIFAYDDGTGSINGVSGLHSVAIRAYGEFASESSGIVNVNVIKENDEYRSKVIGAGNNITQIIGDIATTGGMGAVATISIGLNTADSFWHGNYSKGSGWGVCEGTIGNVNLYIGNQAEWKGYTSYPTYLNMDTGAKWVGYADGYSNLTMDFKNDATWTPTNIGNNVSTSLVQDFTGAGDGETTGKIFMSDENAVNVTFAQYRGTTTFLYDAQDGIAVGGNVTVQAADEGSKAIVKAESLDTDNGMDAYINSLSDKVVYQASDDNFTKVIEIAEGNVLGAITAKVDAEGNITKTEKVNVKNQAISELSSVGLMGWRAGMNDMNKRLGELRDSKGDLGVWVRMINGETEYQGVENEFKTYQIGYDEKLSTDPSWTFGVALSYTEGDANSTGVSAESKSKGLHIYGSKLNDDGSFVDLIARYERLENDFSVSADKGSWDANGYSVSAEYGKRYEKGNGLWIEPQVELTYGTVGAADYTVGSKNVEQDRMNSLVGRVGFSLGKNTSKGNVYARASYLYDFDGEAAVNFVNGDTRRTVEQDLGGGWVEVGVGTNFNFSDATHMYLDVEKTFGGEVDTNWKLNLGVRYSF